MNPGTGSTVLTIGFNGIGQMTFDTALNELLLIDSGSLPAVTSTGVKTQLATSFNQPEGVAVDTLGNIFVSDQVGALNHQTGGNLYKLSSSATPEPGAWMLPAGVACIAAGRSRRGRRSVG